MIEAWISDTGVVCRASGDYSADHDGANEYRNGRRHDCQRAINHIRQGVGTIDRMTRNQTTAGQRNFPRLSRDTARIGGHFVLTATVAYYNRTTGYMSRRDWLAGLGHAGVRYPTRKQMGLIGIREAAQQAGIEPPAMMALTSYKLADAMIARAQTSVPTEE